MHLLEYWGELQALGFSQHKALGFPLRYQGGKVDVGDQFQKSGLPCSSWGQSVVHASLPHLEEHSASYSLAAACLLPVVLAQ